MTMDIFPIELVKAIESISDENRRKIVSLLTEKPFAYTQIKNTLGFTNGNLNHHLIELTQAGLITRYLGTETPGPYEKYYSLSEFGKDFVIGIFNALSPSSSQSTLATDYTKRLIGELRNSFGSSHTVLFAIAANNPRIPKTSEIVVEQYGR